MVLALLTGSVKEGFEGTLTIATRLGECEAGGHGGEGDEEYSSEAHIG